MKRLRRTITCLVAAGLLFQCPLPQAEAKSYGSGGGHSYSSHSSGSSHSFSSGGSRGSSPNSSGSRSSGFTSSSGKSYRSSSSGGSSSRSSSSVGNTSRSSGSGGPSKTFSSDSGKSYSSGSTWSGSDRKSYSSGKSYSAPAGWSSSSSSSSSAGSKHRPTFHWPTRSSPTPARPPDVDQKSSGLTFDTAAARAKREEASKQEFNLFKHSQAAAAKAPVEPPVAGPAAPTAVPAAAGTPPRVSTTVSEPSYRPTPPPIPPSTRSTYSTRVYIPDPDTMATRSIRVGTVFNPYQYRPTVIYRDPYGSLFWWWLLDRSLDDRAYWAYHHRYDMDPARYQALVDSDQQLRARVEELETRQPGRDTNYVPAGLDRDLMYSDRYVGVVYSNRPTMFGAVAFWLLGVPTAIALCAFFIWLVWFKRWQTAT